MARHAQELWAASEGGRESDAGPDGLFPGKPAPAGWSYGPLRELSA
ncbi:hypothetical protein ACIOWK_06280 [Pseudomonas protegens]|nr:hypothetical protein [Pseudomonas protegens]UVM11329.1 hypothetical protein LOY29_01310 [Pseudomonas protegens]